MTEVQHSPLNGRLEDLRSEHRALDHELKNIADDLLIDDLQVQRLKKRKLFLKDSINHLEDKLVPDIIA
tara:strand:+ start:948 stop:1154 length:207 start_codon:yes stop_codon:yes gene_type:complete